MISAGHPDADPGASAGVRQAIGASAVSGGGGTAGDAIDSGPFDVAENSSNTPPGPDGNHACAPGGWAGPGTSGRGPLGSNQEATVWRSDGPPARPKWAGVPRCAMPPAGPAMAETVDAPGVMAVSAPGARSGSWVAWSRACRSLLRKVWRSVAKRWL